MKKTTYLCIQTILAGIYFIFGLILLFLKKDISLIVTVFGIALMFASNWMSEKSK